MSAATPPTTDWFSTTPNPASENDGLYDYCQFCLNNFKRFNEMINNVCRSCGRVAQPIMRDKQENLKVTSVNASVDQSQMKGVAMDIDYSPLERDPTTLNQSSNGVMKANSLGEAARMLRKAEISTTAMAAAKLRNEKYIVKPYKPSRDKMKGVDNELGSEYNNNIYEE